LTNSDSGDRPEDTAQNDPFEPAEPLGDNERAWQSDVIVDLIKRYEFPYITLNPGASFRGLHDSLVNYGGNQPPMLLCQHEEIAVQMAHGYAKATGRPMIAIVHNLVGMLHATMAVYYAYIDRAPIFIIGATGPMDEAKRRPNIDWIHSAASQGEAYRAFTKWDYQPASIEGVPEAFLRAYSVMMTQPQGPIYMCYDTFMQELPLTTEVPLPPDDAVAAPSPIGPEPKALEAVAERLLAAETPLLMAEFVGRTAGGFENMVALAEAVRAPVWDIGSSLNFPGRHPLNLSLDTGVFADRDVILNLDVQDWERPIAALDKTTRAVEYRVPDTCEWMEIGFAELGISKWSMDYRRTRGFTHRVLADPAVAIPMLTEHCRARVAADSTLARRLDDRAGAIAQRHRVLRKTWAKQAREDWDAAPMTPARLAAEIWDAIQGEDWVLSANTLRGWARKLWDFDKPYRHPGKALGTSTQIGISLGVALANRGTGRLVVDINPDGDLMFDLGALWVAAKYEIPMLIVMFNNRAYFNDWEHQVRMAQQRGRAVERAHIGMDLYGPDPDFAGIARAQGWYAEGPIEDGNDVGPALRRAIEEVKAGRPALVDTITRHR
jgi:acetolactate synthase-1/2/3 large subunit